MYAWFLAAALSVAMPDEGVGVTAPALPAESPATVMALPAPLRQRLHEEVLSVPATQRQRLDQLLHFIVDADALGIAYDEGATYSVEQTYATHRANCLSFTLLFLAIAREAGLDVHAQEIRNSLSWRQQEGTIYRTNHVNATVGIRGRNFVVDIFGNDVIAGDVPVVMSEQRLLAHYYNNLAMDRLSDGNTANGLRLMEAALALDPNYAPLWSNAGVLHVHSGDLATAEQAYLKALSLDPQEDGALFNMVSLTRRLGDSGREAGYRRRLERVQRNDPLNHFMQAMDYERNGDYTQAIQHYRRAIHLYAGEHRFYSALARVYLKAGNPRRAGNALKRAQALADGATRAAYSAQLQELKRLSN
jgi:Flp pilus assembly protein TadD